MPIKKLDYDGIHPANPIVDVIAEINDNLDAIVEAFNNVNGGSGVVGPTGPKGDKGDRGDAGIQGEKGDKGDTGDKGDPGKDGVDGKDGVAGEPGPKGDKGDKGDTGTQGPAGVKGDKGDTGAIGPAGVGIKGFASGYVDAGQFVTLDNLKFSVTTGGSRGLSCATVSGTSMLAISASYAMINGGYGGNATNWSTMPTYTTTPSGSWFGWSFPNAGDGSTYNIQEIATQRFYRVTLMIGPGYTKNFISIERLN